MCRKWERASCCFKLSWSSVQDFSFLCKMMQFKRKCCNPFGVKKCAKQLLDVRPSRRLKLERVNVAGSVICSTCNIEISKLKQVSDSIAPSTSSNATNPNIIESICVTPDTSENESDCDDEIAEYHNLEVISSINKAIGPILRVTNFIGKNIVWKLHS